MKILVIGTGTIGKAIVKKLSLKHTIITAALHSGDEQVNVLDKASIEQLFKKIGKIDALITALGNPPWIPLEDIKDDSFYLTGLKDKLLSQVNTVLLGRDYMNDHGSFTITSGMISGAKPLKNTTAIAMAHGALEGWAQATAWELLALKRGLRLNVVSPVLVNESYASYGEYFKGYESVPVDRVALAYEKSVEGIETAQIYKVWGTN